MGSLQTAVEAKRLVCLLSLHGLMLLSRLPQISLLVVSTLRVTPNGHLVLVNLSVTSIAGQTADLQVMQFAKGGRVDGGIGRIGREGEGNGV